MTLKLGVTPVSMALELTEDGDFVSTIVSDDGDWNPGTEIAVEVGEARWLATILGTDARWEIDKSEVNAVLFDADGNKTPPEKWRLMYKDGDADLVWARGGVITNYA